MNNLVKQYSDAFIETLGNEKSLLLLQKKELLNACFANREFLGMIAYPLMGGEQKFEILKELIEIEDAKILQALCVLAQADRLALLPQILEEMRMTLQSQQKQCQAILFTQKPLENQLKQILSQKLQEQIGYTVLIEERIWDKEGMKCCIDELFLEISFSKEKLVQDLKSFILDSFTKGVQIEN